MKGRIRTPIYIFNCQIEAEFEAELLPDGSLRLEYLEPLILPRGSFRLLTLQKGR